MQGVSLQTYDDHFLDMNKVEEDLEEVYNRLYDCEKAQYLVEFPVCDVQALIPLLSSIDIHQKNKYGETLLHSAIPDGSLEVIQLLVES
jgi:ankyrin repeat protein